jgi:hypothetical protein
LARRPRPGVVGWLGLAGAIPIAAIPACNDAAAPCAGNDGGGSASNLEAAAGDGASDSGATAEGASDSAAIADGPGEGGANACPSALDKVSGTTCYSGRDGNGAYYLIAIPPTWNQGLFLYSPGGPDFSYNAPSQPDTITASNLLLTKGFAVATTSFSRNGWEVGSNAWDIENLRQLFVRKFGRPGSTFVVGGSYSGSVLAKVVERFGTNADGSKNYDGAAIGCGLLGGLNRYFAAWLDMRVVYQFYCNNYPRPSEAQYPLYMGRAAGIDFAQAGSHDTTGRVSECIGPQAFPGSGGGADAGATQSQQQNWMNIKSVLRLPSYMNVIFPSLDLPAGQGLRDFTQVTLGGRNAIPSTGVVYAGSTDDGALNQGVARYDADPAAQAWVVADTQPTGHIAIPVLTFHTKGDPIVFVESERVYRNLVQSQGNLGNLAQLFVDDLSIANLPNGHCGFTASEFAATFDLITHWAKSGTAPTAADATAACEAYLQQSSNQSQDGCRFDALFYPPPWASRVYPRGSDPVDTQ